MKLSAFEVPDDPAQLGGWLERQLVGMELGRLVAELAAVHQDQPHANGSVRDLLGTDLLRLILAEGLAPVPPDQLRQLLLQPRYLLELQELVLFAGGPHWQRLLESVLAGEPTFVQGKARLESYLANRAGANTPYRLLRPKTPWYQRPVIVALATAAVVLLGVALFDTFTPPPRPTTWGWEKPGALPQTGPAKDYFNRLADGAQEWFNQRPEDGRSLAIRITEFRRGCSLLLLSNHPPLSDEQRDWLHQRCQAWAGKFDKHLADLESGQDPTKVRNDVDQTVNNLVKALREQASL